jgi:hypothetical protein
MIVFFQPIYESEPITGEIPYAAVVDRTPCIKQQGVSMGLEPRWTIVGMDVYESDVDKSFAPTSEPICVAYCAVDTGCAHINDRQTWDYIRFDEDWVINLQLFFHQEQQITYEWNFVGGSPQIGQILEKFDVAAHQIHPLPLQVATVQEYKPISDACYTSVYFAECKAVELAIAKR